MIDSDGYRPNVGIIICNRHGQVLWARRFGQNSWQFPQGGINQHETPEQAMFRELNEEVGLAPQNVKILAETSGWLKYKLPKRIVRWDNIPVCIGQKQKWFLLELISDETAINLQKSSTPEFDNWRWVSYWYPIRQVIAFKREVYRKAMKEFAHVIFNVEHMHKETSKIKPIPYNVMRAGTTKDQSSKRRSNLFNRKKQNKQH